MGVHGGRRGEPDGLADLAHGRRVAVPVDVVDEKGPDLLLASGELHFHGLLARGRVERVFDRRVETPPDGVKRNDKGRPEGRPEAMQAGEDLNLHGLFGH